MPDSTANNNSTASIIQFIQSHRPAIPEGDYRISITQEISSVSDQKIPKTTFSASRNFQVLGERFEFKPEDIDSVFPPDGSLGDHSNVLPHIILNRSTLPWERSADKNNQNVSWLAILLFEEDEKPAPQVITLGELKNISGYPAKFPAITLEGWQSDNDKVSVIDIKKSVLQRQLPAKSDLSYLSHARLGKDAAGKQIGGEQAVIIGNRLPAKGAISTAHLVSLEERYNGDDFDFQNAGDDDSIRLVSLKSWSFACSDERQNFKGLLVNLNLSPGTLRLPDSNSAEANRHLALGYVPLPHSFRQGSKSVSWYRGPLIPGENKTELSLPVRASDELARYETSAGMFDASYAAAWELGRLLTLQNKRVSVSLYNWKRANAQQLAKQEKQLLQSPLPTQTEAAQTDLPDEIESWFDSLRLLKEVPFNYLVPDERMLPVESIRFFWVDAVWENCLADGAFSIGRVTSSDYSLDQSLSSDIMPDTPEKITGFLLRSSVVAGWPGLIVEAYDSAQSKLDIVRRDALSDSVLLILVKGEINSIKMHQKPEALHFGLDAPDSSHPQFYKKLRDIQGNEKGVELSSIPWRDETNRVINVNELAIAIKNKSGWSALTSAQFALQMIEGGDEVNFQKTAQRQSQ